MIRQKIRAIFVSDLHLGSRQSQDRRLMLFLKRYKPDKLFLCGDIIDFWALQIEFYWPRSHWYCLREILRVKEIVYILGNHDAALKGFLGQYQNVNIVNHAYYTTAKGKRLLITHGDEFDTLIRLRTLTNLSNRLYHLALKKSRPVAKLFNKLVKLLSRGYSKRAIKQAKRYNVDGIVCGHLHHVERLQEKDICYYNIGDWVGNDSALIEDMGGNLKLVRFP